MTTAINTGARIYNIVESVILCMSVLLICWTAKVVIAQGNVLASHEAHIETNTTRLDSLEDRGSRSLESHAKLDDNRDINSSERLAKVEAAVIVLQTLPIEVKAIMIKLEGLNEGQLRIEKQLEKIKP